MGNVTSLLGNLVCRFGPYQLRVEWISIHRVDFGTNSFQRTGTFSHSEVAQGQSGRGDTHRHLSWVLPCERIKAFSLKATTELPGDWDKQPFKLSHVL